MNYVGLRRTIKAEDLERELGLDLEPWLIAFAARLKVHRQRGHTGVAIQYKDRLILAACIGYQYLLPALRRVERELQGFLRVRIQERGGEMSDINRY